MQHNNYPVLWAQPLNKETSTIYGARFYTGPPTWAEYYSDFGIFKKLSKQLVEMHNGSSKASLRKVLNDFISLSNVFAGKSLARLAFAISNPLVYSELKTILYFIKRLPTDLPEVKLSDISFDVNLLSSLQAI